MWTDWWTTKVQVNSAAWSLNEISTIVATDSILFSTDDNSLSIENWGSRHINYWQRSSSWPKGAGGRLPPQSPLRVELYLHPDKIFWIFQVKNVGAGGTTLSPVPTEGGAVPPPRQNFLNFSSEKCRVFKHFYCKKTTCGHKPGPGASSTPTGGSWRCKMQGVENLSGGQHPQPPVKWHPDWGSR